MKEILASQIATLEAKGFKVRFRHTRSSRDEVEWALAERRAGNTTQIPPTHPKFLLREAGIEIDPRAGQTTALVYLGDNVVAEGRAICSPLDQFNKREGALLALGRAIHDLDLAGRRSDD